MGLDALRKFGRNAADNPPEAPHQEIELPKGSRSGDWLTLLNARLKRKEGYEFLERRGGSSVINTVPSGDNILYLQGFQSQVAALTKNYIAIHTDGGDLYLYDVDGDSFSLIASGFSTTDPVQILPNNRFIYVFDVDYGVAKYYDILTDSAFNWLDYNHNYIYNHNWTGVDNLDDYPENPLGFAEGQKAICFPNYKNVGDPIGLSGTLSESQYGTRAFLYDYTDGGQYITDTATGEEYKADTVIVLAPSQTLNYTVNGSGTAPEIRRLIAPIKGNEVYFKSFVVTIEKINANSISFSADDDSIDPGRTLSQFGEPASGTSSEGQPELIPHNTSLAETYLDNPAAFKVAGANVVENADYTPPTFHKGFIVIDRLDDSSFTLPGKPYSISTSINDLYDSDQDVKLINLSLNINTADNISARLVYVSRWLPELETIYQPSSDQFPNGSYYLDQEYETNLTVLTFKKPDRLLLEPIASRIPLSGGVPVYFGSDQLTLNSIEQFGGGFLFGGYRINRPIPIPYANPQTANKGNIYTNIQPTTQLPEDVALSFLFEYTDGKKSNIVDTAQFLQEGTVTETVTISDCGQIKSSALFEVTAGASSDGDIVLDFDFSAVSPTPNASTSFDVTVSLTTASHSTPDTAATAIVDQLNADPTFSDYLSASVVTSTSVEITLLGFGEDLDGIVISETSNTTGVTHTGLPATTADAEDPQGEPAQVTITDIGNFLGSGDSKQYQLFIDDVVFSTWTAEWNDGESQIIGKINSNFSGTGWSSELQDGDLLIKSTDLGNTAFNNIPVRIESSDTTFGIVTYTLAAPGRTDVVSGTSQEQLTNGAGESCQPGTVTLEPTNNGVGTTEDYTITIDGIQIFDGTISSGDSLTDIATAIETSSLEVADFNGSWKVSRDTAQLTFTHREYGTIGNGKSLVVTPAGAGDVSFTNTSPSSGGTDEGATIPSGSAQEVNANRVQIHSLNALVSKIIILGRVSNGSDTYYHLDEIEISESGAHGFYVELPNSSSQLASFLSSPYQVPATEDILEAPVLQNYIGAALPAQQILIDSQKPIKDNSVIQGLLKESFDVDKTEMRYRVWVFTDQNVQQGYYVEQTVSFSDSGQVYTSYNAEFEVYSDRMVLRSRNGFARIKGQVFMQSFDGIYNLSDVDSPLIYNRDETALENNKVKNIAYNQDNNEIWYVVDQSEVLVLDINYGTIRTYDFNTLPGSISSAISFQNTMYAGFGDSLVIVDDQTVDTDFGLPLTGVATMNHIGNPTQQAKILEVVIGGEAETVQIRVDLEIPRRERNNDAWDPSFDADYTSSQKTAYIHGTSFQVHRTAVMPRLQLRMSGSRGFISHLLVKYVLLENKGKARI